MAVRSVQWLCSPLPHPPSDSREVCPSIRLPGLCAQVSVPRLSGLDRPTTGAAVSGPAPHPSARCAIKQKPPHAPLGTSHHGCGSSAELLQPQGLAWAVASRGTPVRHRPSPAGRTRCAASCGPVRASFVPGSDVAVQTACADWPHSRYPQQRGRSWPVPRALLVFLVPSVR